MTMSNKENFNDCVVSFLDTAKELKDVENKLAKRFKIRKNIRATLIKMDKQGELKEDELVQDWHDLYSSYLDWIKRTE